MKYLLDTCVISELIEKRPSKRVSEWLEDQDEFALYLSVITLGEIQKEIGRLPRGKKRRRNQDWVTNDLTRRFMGRILPIDENVAQRWGDLSADAEKTGHPVPVLDGLLAATALTYGLTLVTRNVSHIEYTNVSLLDPWQR